MYTHVDIQCIHIQVDPNDRLVNRYDDDPQLV